MAETKNIEEHITGDTFAGLQIELLEGSPLAPVNLTGAEVRAQFRTGYNANVALDLSIGDGMSFINAANGLFQIDEQIIDVVPGLYLYDIQVTFPTGRVITYVKGSWKILNDITRAES